VAMAVHGGLTTISRSTEVSDRKRPRHPFYGRGRFHGACLATRRRVPILSKWGRRVELAIVQEDTTSRCHRFFSRTQRRHFFPPPNPTNRDPRPVTDPSMRRSDLDRGTGLSEFEMGG